MGGEAGGGELCPACDRRAVIAEREAAAQEFESSQEARGDKRFVSLSALPENQRVPSKRGLPMGRSLREQAAPQSMLPSPAPAPQPPVPIPPRDARQLGFNCPSCFMVLIIREPSVYDGRAAPCPSCGAVIMPPRLAPANPFSIVMRSGPAAQAGLPGYPGAI